MFCSRSLFFVTYHECSAVLMSSRKFLIREHHYTSPCAWRPSPCPGLQCRKSSMTVHSLGSRSYNVSINTLFLDLFWLYFKQGRKPGTKCGGASCAGCLGDRSPPVGSRGEAPVGGLGDEVPQKLKQFWISICIIWT